MKNELEKICDAIFGRTEQTEEENLEDPTYQSLLEQNRKKLDYEPKKDYEDFLDLVSSVRGELD